jgi:hypothetical protein
VAYGLFWCAALAGGAAKDAYEQFVLGYELYTPEELLPVFVGQAVLGMLLFLVALWAWRNRI